MTHLTRLQSIAAAHRPTRCFNTALSGVHRNDLNPRMCYALSPRGSCIDPGEREFRGEVEFSAATSARIAAGDDGLREACLESAVSARIWRGAGPINLQDL